MRNIEVNCTVIENYGSFCVGGIHRFATTKIAEDKISGANKEIFAFCSICNRKQSMTVSDNIVTAEGFGNFLKSLGKKRPNASNRMAKFFLKKTWKS